MGKNAFRAFSPLFIPLLFFLAVFCPNTLRDAICIGPVPIDFPTLFTFVYQLGVGVGLLITFFSSVLQ